MHLRIENEAATKPRNRLLAGISASDWARISKHFEPLELNRGDVLVEAGERFSHVFFPEEGLVSTVATFESGAVAETATTGSEGVVSVGAVLGGTRALNRHVVQVPGVGLRIEIGQFEKVQRDHAAFRQKLFAYIQVFVGQAMQSVACNVTHSIEERCARWLLMCHDRSAHDQISLTQEALADILGVSRPAVNRVARMLQSAGLIRYARGVLVIEDRQGLEATSCECYATIRQQFDQLLPGSFVR